MDPSKPLRLVIALGLGLAAGCSSSSSPRGGDAGAPSPDASAAVPDAGTLAQDAGAIAPDAGGSGPDAGDRSPDGGAQDAGTVTATIACAPDGGTLLRNGSFELPAAPRGSYLISSVGSDLAGWRVVGTGGDVSPLSGTFVQDGFSFPAEDGAQALDLTGLGSNAANGVSQVVTTTVGASYRLCFWVGNISDPGGTFGTSSAVDVRIDGRSVLRAVNDQGAGTRTLAWKAFALQFMAATASTTIELINADPPSDNSNILDNVVLQR